MCAPNSPPPTDPPHWFAPPEGLIELNERTVHLWRCKLDEVGADESGFLNLISADERQRAERFRVEGPRRQFIVTRGVLRMILSRYLSLPPNAINFAYTGHGKPYIKNQQPHQISFNLAHSDEICLIGLACRDRLGVDVERIRPDIDYDNVARQTFSLEQIAVLEAVDASLRAQTFFECWTRKEAYLKAIGEGLSADIQYAVPDARRWTLFNLSPDPSYIAAVAVEVCRVHVDLWNWRP